MPSQDFLDGIEFEQISKQLGGIFKFVDEANSAGARDERRDIVKNTLDEVYIRFTELEKRHYGEVCQDTKHIRFQVLCCRSEEFYQDYKRGMEAERARLLKEG